MPWELGYFDGLGGAISVLPIVKAENEVFNGQEFLGLYPYVDYVNDFVLYVNKGEADQESLGKIDKEQNFKSFKEWMDERGRR
jgi:hypothetical protein